MLSTGFLFFAVKSTHPLRSTPMLRRPSAAAFHAGPAICDPPAHTSSFFVTELTLCFAATSRQRPRQDSLGIRRRRRSSCSTAVSFWGWTVLGNVWFAMSHVTRHTAHVTRHASHVTFEIPTRDAAPQVDPRQGRKARPQGDSQQRYVARLHEVF